ncbi:MAG: glycosyltransferase family 1 protein [Flavobacterium sp.]|uniref:glycosyltransferase family 4 protein n=1 Tax=Flavobacterium sp. TaxID=239 RepID=UPI001211D20E|nr:glycosyltransferase family 4 protein [Flavobacterium sp.]RZJ66060.1 MAG: glycosyltransferase family 1 protein [Flavobacterium sp.]
MHKKKIIRTSTVPITLDNLLRGQLAFLDRYYDVIAVSGEGENLRAVEQREQVTVIPLQMYRNIKPFHDLVSLWKLYRLFKKERPFLVHSMTPKAGLLTMTAGWLARIPVRAHTFTGLVFPSKTGAMQKLLILMDRLLCRFATDIFPEGEGVKRDLQHFDITKKPLTIIGNGNVNGIDTDFFNPDKIDESEKNQLRASLSIAPDDFVFIFVGRLVKDKGITELVGAFLEMTALHANVKLLLVGDYEPELDPLPAGTIRAIESEKNIITTGWQTETRNFYAISDALVLPSYREGFPNSVLQAGAMGLPSIVTDINGSNEIVIPRKNGLIVAPKNQSELLGAMLEIYDDKELFALMRQNARPSIVERFSQTELWNALLAKYRSLENKK